MTLKDFIIVSLHEFISRPYKVYEVEFDLNMVPVQHIKDGNKVCEIMVIGEGNPNHSRIKFKVNL